VIGLDVAITSNDFGPSCVTKLSPKTISLHSVSNATRSAKVMFSFSRVAPASDDPTWRASSSLKKGVSH
jgi:hypothetical protein